VEKRRIEKLPYMHRNPVKRGLVLEPQQWALSSFCHHAEGRHGPVLVNEPRKAELHVREVACDYFQMFLLWKPSGVTNPIPVPLGSVNWNWNGDATLNTTTMNWSLNSGSVTPSPTFIESTTYPTWQNVMLKSQVACN